MSRDGDLHGREPSRAVLMTGKDVHWLPGIPEARAISVMSQSHEPFIRPPPMCRRRPAMRHHILIRRSWCAAVCRKGPERLC